MNWWSFALGVVTTLAGLVAGYCLGVAYATYRWEHR